jgi:hypothetical protein
VECGYLSEVKDYYTKHADEINLNIVNERKKKKDEEIILSNN